MFGTSSELLSAIGTTTSQTLGNLTIFFEVMLGVAIFLLLFGLLISGFGHAAKGLLK